VIRKAFEIRKTAKLSQPALEVLTIIAYYQPTTRAYVDQVRGVDSSYTVGLLLERGLIEECGRLQVPGRPRLYRTTKKFLRDFHLGSLEELPEMPGLEADGQLRMTDDGTILDPGSLAAKEESPLTNEGR
jgi:segregation and condensation protein B